MGQIGRLAGLFLLLVGAGACAGEVEEGTGPSSASSSSPVDLSIKPPVLTQIDLFAGALRLTWEATACDAIEGERRTKEAPFEVLFSVPGTDSVFVDAEAIKDEEYTYRLRCLRGSSMSDYSNELTANPADG